MLTNLNDASIARLVAIALAEDIDTGDISAESTIDPESVSSARFLVKEDGVLCGLDIARLVFHTLDPHIEWTTFAAEGDFIKAGTTVARVHGKTQTLLSGERTALNFMQRMSGVATLTRRYVAAVEGTNATILDTRKTIPGWRILDKYAVRTGGGANHRFGLFDMVMLKDNHIQAAGGIAEAVSSCLQYLDGKKMPIEVETQSLDDVRVALSCPGVTRIMFDNFTPELTKEAVAIVAGKVETESSGGINLDTIRSFAEQGVDFISVGALTHSAAALDISMKFIDS